MDGVLVLAHGSRRKETEETLDLLVRKAKQKTGNELIHSAFLQFSEKDLNMGIDGLVSEGATSIVVVPLFIFEGVHVTEDIPNELELIRNKYPNIDIKLSESLGADDRIADIIADRVMGLRDTVKDMY